ncbi:hypothetical protein [Dictyobacter arantiisoli]|uniref:Uncharacterized protein n=1 Tax=Dictyobacter arantiisoli TaxID=2014874 RepID=A0A5A5TL47_9CHLR|nr:hypothetical protein [Dictyobacter arantiisoli]GCF11783.1 hypothetical protein KDI_53470 [Dictyobacter arantiisoli]
MISASQTAAMMNGGGDREIHVHNHIYLDGQEITNKVMTRAVKQIRGQGGMMVNV